MTPVGHEVLWGDKLEVVDKNKSKNSIFNLRLKPSASDEDKRGFESYAMNVMGGNHFMKKGYPHMKEPYYTWEGRVVERASLRGRGFPTV